MKSCPFCHTDLSNCEQPTLRCPVCDTVLSIGDDEAPPAFEPDQDADLPLPDLNVRAHIRSIVDRTQAEPPLDSGDDEPLLDLPSNEESPRELSENDFTIAFVADDTLSPFEQVPQSESPSDASDDLAFSIDLPPAGDDDQSAPRELSESDYTVAFLDNAEPDDPNTMATNATGMTIDASELPPDRLEMLTGIWSDTVAPDAKPGMTIRGGAPNSATQTQLVVRPRSVRPHDEPTPDGADYELLEMIGEGGMGVVYSARQASIDRMVAIKMIRREMSGNVDQRQKFLSEAVVTGDLDHPNIVPIYDLGSNETGALFYSMKRVEGTPWMKVIRSKTLEENLEILMKVADAVAFAHSRGVVHRDLKPENVMLGEFGEVLVMDWGLALLAPRFRHLGTITQSGGMGGTPAYMAPEMACGPLDRINTFSDIYLLGAILYEILTGKPPHAGKDVMTCLRAVARNDIQPTDKSGELVDIALKAMATEMTDRYDSVLSFQAAIRLYFSHSESIALSVRAAEDLSKAEQTKDYQDFARAVFGFQEALVLWEGNDRARSNLLIARTKYAECAQAKGDLDLAQSLLDADEPSYADLRNSIVAAMRERNARQQRLKVMVRAARALVAAIIIVVTGAVFLIRAQREEAVAQRDRAVVAEKSAIESRELAVKEEKNALAQAERAKVAEAEAKTQRDEAVAAEGRATEQRNRAVSAEELARQERDRAVAAETQAKADRDKALLAEKAEAAARAQEEILRQQKEYDAYIAQVGLISAKIDENAFGYAAQLLNECKPELRNWEWGRLMHLCRQSSQTLTEGGPIDAVAVSPDGKQVFTGSWNGTAHLWNLDTGKAALELKHGQYVHAVAFSPDGRQLATGSDDESGEVRLWDAENGALIKTLPDHEDAVLSIVFSRDGKRLLTSSYDNTARLWDVETGNLLRVFQGHSWWVWSAAFSPDESRIVTASQDGTAIVWSTTTSEKSAPFNGHTGPVYCASFSNDGQSIATCGYDKRILLWRPDDLRPFDFDSVGSQQRAPSTHFIALDEHTAPVRCVRFSDDGATLLSASHDNTIKLWDLKSRACTQTLRGHAGWVRSCAFVPTRSLIVSGGYDQQAKVWDVSAYLEVRTLKGHADALLAAAFSHDGSRVVTASRDRTAKIWNPDSGEQLKTLGEGHAFLVSTVAFSSDASKVFTGAGDGTVRVWNRASGGQVLQFDDTGHNGIFALAADEKRILTGGNDNKALIWDAESGGLILELAAHRSDITAVAYSPDQRLLFTGDLRGHGKLWDATTGKVLRELEAHSRKITAACFSHDSKRVFTASGDNSVGQWDTATGQELISLVLKHPDSVTAIALAPDGKHLLTSCADAKLRLWNVETARSVRDFDVQGKTVASVSFSSDGGLLIAACTDGNVRVWKVATGKEVESPSATKRGAAFLNVGRGDVWAAVFSRDGDLILTAGGNDARLWDVATSRELMTFSPHSAVSAASFSPDGSRVATASWDGTVKLWSTLDGTVGMKIRASHDKYVNSVMFSPDGSQMLTSSDDRTARLWDVTSGQLLRTFPSDEAQQDGHLDSVRAARFSQDGKRIVTASNDKTARIWDTDTGALLVTLTGHQWSVLSAEFSTDGKQVLTGSEDNSARIWDVASGRQLMVLQGHTASVTSVAFSPDGQRAVTGAQDNSVKIWDAMTGKEVLHLKQHQQEVSSVAFSPDGKSLLTGSRDGTAIVWPAVDWQPGP